MEWEQKELEALRDKLEACFSEALDLRDKDGDVVFWWNELNECAEHIEKAIWCTNYLLNPPDYPEEDDYEPSKEEVAAYMEALGRYFQGEIEERPLLGKG